MEVVVFLAALTRQHEWQYSRDSLHTVHVSSLLNFVALTARFGG